MGTKKKAKPSGKDSKQEKAPAPEPPESAAEVLGNEAAYLAFLPGAKKLPAEQVRHLNGDPMLAKTNVQRGVDAVLARAPELVGRFTTQEIDQARKLPELALALTFAVARIDAIETSSDGSLGQKMARARFLRRVLLKSAEACADSGDIPSTEVSAILAGRGQIDTAQDCVQLAALYRKHKAALAGKTPATAAMLAEAATLGSELVALLQTSTTRKRAKVNASLDEALDHRDRLWTLLDDGYEGVWKMGAILWGRRVDEHVPPLLSRMATPTTKPTPPAA